MGKERGDDDMANVVYAYEPDYAVSPGEILGEHLEARELSQAEFARRCGRSPKLISEIIAGKAPVEPRTALQFERTLGMDAAIWLGIESDYRLHLERQAQKAADDKLQDWAARFPYSELAKRGRVPKLAAAARSERAAALLSFFGVASIEAWRDKWEKKAVAAYRHSPSFQSDGYALAAWLRIGEADAESADCADYGEPAFRRALTEIRALTRGAFNETIAETRRLCQESGVFLAITKPLPKTALSGAARWLTPRKAIIQLSARHMSDDHLWFSLFHEAAHILLHGKKGIFLDAKTKGGITEQDAEADEWARDFLIPRPAWDGFAQSQRFTTVDVLEFAEEQGIAPGIVVGRLQHDKRIPWSALNHLKNPLKWGG